MAPRQVRVLVEDRELGEVVEADRRLLAERACVADGVVLQRGRWNAGRYASETAGGFGLLVLNGLISGRVGRKGGYGAELLGPGDLLRPLPRPDARSAETFDSHWVVIHKARVAVLGPEFVERAAPYPEVATALVARALLRTRTLAVNMAIVHHPRVDTRLHMLFWHLARRWGRVTPDGTLLPLPITHALLAEIVASRRPSVSKAMSELADADLVTRQGTGWLLRGLSPEELTEFSPSD